MQFQTLDDKKECVGIYQNGQLYFNQSLPDNLARTWSYSAFLEDKNIEYARLYCEGRTLDEVCPEALQDRWQAAVQQSRPLLFAGRGYRNFHRVASRHLDRRRVLPGHDIGGYTGVDRVDCPPGDVHMFRR